MKERGYNLKDIEKQYYVRKEIAEIVNYIDAENQNLIKSLKGKIISYISQLQKYNLRDHLLHPEIINKMNFGKFILDYIIICFGMPLYFIGLAMNYPPYYISKRFTDKKIKKVEFYASFYANMSMLLWVFYYGIQLILAALFFRSWIFLGIYALLVPLTGFYVLKFYSAMKKTFGHWRLLRLVSKDRNVIEQLVNERTQIITEIELAKKEYQSSLE